MSDQRPPTELEKEALNQFADFINGSPSLKLEINEEVKSMNETEIKLNNFIVAPFRETELSPLAQEVGLLALKGLSASEIAEAVQRHPRTINYHLANVTRAIGIGGTRDFQGWFFDQVEKIAKGGAGE